MLSDAYLSTVMQIGITGAGLVLAIYALIIPISKKMFTYRAIMLRDQVKLFEEQLKNLTPEVKKEEFKHLQQSADAVKETKIFPRYLSVGVLFVFVFYILLAVTASGMMINADSRIPLNEMLIQWLFFIACISFLSLGVYTIADISATMRREYERIKKKLEQDKEFQGLFVK